METTGGPISWGQLTQLIVITIEETMRRCRDMPCMEVEVEECVEEALVIEATI